MQLTLNLQGQSPVPLVTWIAHTETIGSGIVSVVEVIPSNAGGAAFLQSNVGKSFSGTNAVVLTDGAATMWGISSSTATILPGPPAGFPVAAAAAGQQQPVYIQFGS